MCFSPQGDLVGGIVITAIGVDALVHVKGRPEYIVAATLPVLFGLHQIDETFVWWGLQGHVGADVGRVAMWIYLAFAMVVLPTLAPAMMTMAEPDRHRQRIMIPFIGVGAVVSAVLLETMVVNEPHVMLGHYHIAYSLGLQHGVFWIFLYIVATCGPLFLSSFRHVFWFGVANVAAVVALALLCASGFTSLWCFYAAIVSGAIALHLRFASNDMRKPPRVRVESVHDLAQSD